MTYFYLALAAALCCVLGYVLLFTGGNDIPVSQRAVFAACGTIAFVAGAALAFADLILLLVHYLS